MTEIQRKIALAIIRNGPSTVTELFREIQTMNAATIRRNLNSGPFTFTTEWGPRGKVRRWRIEESSNETCSVAR